ncbi:isopenicillin N synthase family oxygenase [Pseudonocardia sp. WMMC193]|uniref:isopenicillin N synthase family dioxygenase n=1 Tax=Pseudonocardia sp. WMMC193 TaxID=2911965 RepID=UPI001F288E59|nr:2OG-Fe(II) oxygenase family protein [Pseudonocardia sp. WMMC193]MCF7549952.1 hypothetical protein [Pseudonocardia sp. WMMC193]
MTSSQVPADFIPVIDVASFLDGSDLETAPRQVNEAAVNSGFFQITGHGVPRELIDAVYAKSVELANTPQEYRDSLVSPVGHPYRGLTTNIDAEGTVRSLRVHASHFDDAAAAEAAGVPADYADFFSPNVWPDEVAGYRAAVGALFARTQELGAALMRLFAVALEMPIDYFDALVEPNASSCSINYYPPRGAPLREDPTVIFDEHFDGGTLTMLHQRGTYEGLQVKDRDGAWVSVPVVDEALVINMGELMMRWTNGRWPATRHRVIASTDPAGHRTTLTTFHLPAVDTVIDPLASTVGAEGPRFDAVSVYDWEQRFIKKTYAERRFLKAGAATERYLAELAEK